MLVCGGRNFDNRDMFGRAMYEHVAKRSEFFTEDDNWLPSDIHIIAGGASGADTMAIDWAVVNWSPFTEYPADWAKHGKAAGAIRNQQMLDDGKPNLVLAFPGGRGTADMIRRARKAGVPVIEIDGAQTTSSPDVSPT